MATTFTSAPEVWDLVLDLVPEHHPHLDDPEVGFVCLFRDDVPKSAGKDVWGTASKLSPREAFLAAERLESVQPVAPPSVGFRIEISRPAWDQLKDDARRALVDHELMHCWAEWVEKDDGSELKLSIQPHDLEVFRAEYARYGDWRPDIAEFTATVKAAQLLLDLDPRQLEIAERLLAEVQFAAGVPG